jgi:hypothetical protein
LVGLGAGGRAEMPGGRAISPFLIGQIKNIRFTNQ